MGTGDYIYIAIALYFFIFGLLGTNMILIWITMLLKVKVYDLEYLYGRTAARIVYILFGVGVLFYRFVVVDYLMYNLGI